MPTRSTRKRGISSTALVSGRRQESSSASDAMLNKVRGQLEPAFAFAISYLRMLSQNLGLGALAVWFGTQGIEQYVAGSSKEFDWHNQLADLLRTSAPLGPKGLSPFCSALRRKQEGLRRCRECDAYWIARTRKSGRSWTYQCHAGLSEVVTPIVVNGKCVGEVMGGQLASRDDLPSGFDDVWVRIKDIDGLNREELGQAFESVRPADRDHLNRVRISLQAAARVLGALIESVADLMSRETMLGQVRGHLERDFAWLALTETGASREEIDARARALGFTETPSIVVVVQPDRSSRAALLRPSQQATRGVPAMFEAAQRLLTGVPNSLVSSIRPGELVVLISPGSSRNPALRGVRVRELVANLKRELEVHCATPILAGVGGLDSGHSSLAMSYEEARNAMQPEPLSGTLETPKTAAGDLALVARMAELGREAQAAARAGDRTRYATLLETQLRVLAGNVPHSDELRQCLFAQVVFDALTALRNGGDASGADRIQVAYAANQSAIRTGADMVEWISGNVLPVLDRLWAFPVSIRSRRLGQVSDIVSRSIAERPRRENVARVLGLSGDCLGKTIRKNAGLTYRELLRRLRIRQAQELLLIPGKTVAQVAAEVGYTTSAAFSRAFEKECGASPRVYRNNPSGYPLVPLPDMRAGGV